MHLIWEFGIPAKPWILSKLSVSLWLHCAGNIPGYIFEWCNLWRYAELLWQHDIQSLACGNHMPNARLMFYFSGWVFEDGWHWDSVFPCDEEAQRYCLTYSYFLPCAEDRGTHLRWDSVTTTRIPVVSWSAPSWSVLAWLFWLSSWIYCLV